MEVRVGFRRVETGESRQKIPPGEGRLMHKCREVGKCFGKSKLLNLAGA